MSNGSTSLGYVTTDTGRKAEAWLEFGFSSEKCALTMRIRFVDAETKAPLKINNIATGLEELDLPKTTDREISEEIKKLIT
jgi:hypothetical protein